MNTANDRDRANPEIAIHTGRCLACQGEVDEESGSVTFVSGGALRQIDRETLLPAADLKAFFQLGFRGAQNEDSQGPSGAVSIADEVPTGQFELCFCSTACLRKFFNACINAVEEKLSASPV